MTEPVGGRTPPHIKWLLNERAMLQGELQRLSDRLPVQKSRVETAKAVLENAQAALSRTEHAYEETIQKVQALTVALDSIDPNVDPASVGPVSAWAGKYGERGALTAFLKQLLQDAYPNSLTIQEVVLAVQQKYGVVTSTRGERANLVFSIRARLRGLRALGLVDSLHIPHKSTRASIWRWRCEVPSFEMLRSQEANRDEDPTNREVASQ